MTSERKRSPAKRRKAIIQGTVREPRARSEISRAGSSLDSYGGSGSYAPSSNRATSEEIWAFLLDAVDRHGNPLRSVLVEMHGRTFDGSVRKGDRVKARGRWKHGVFIADEVYDVSTRSLVRAKKGPSLAAKVVAGVVAVFIGAFIGWLGVFLLHNVFHLI